MRKLCVLIAMFLMTYCTSYRRPDVQVIIRHETPDLAASSLLVVNFKSPDHADGRGADVARLLHTHLLSSQKFRLVGLYNDSPWDRMGDTEEERTLNALAEGRRLNYDYILVGELKDFFHGGITRTRVTLKCRIIDIRRGVTIFMARTSHHDQAKDPSLPLNTKLTDASAAPLALAESMVRELIRRI